MYKKYGKNDQRGITWNVGEGGQLFFRAAHGLYLMHIPIKLHEYIMNSE